VRAAEVGQLRPRSQMPSSTQPAGASAEVPIQMRSSWIPIRRELSGRVTNGTAKGDAPRRQLLALGGSAQPPRDQPRDRAARESARVPHGRGFSARHRLPAASKPSCGLSAPLSDVQNAVDRDECVLVGGLDRDPGQSTLSGILDKVLVSSDGPRAAAHAARTSSWRKLNYGGLSTRTPRTAKALRRFPRRMPLAGEFFVVEDAGNDAPFGEGWPLRRSAVSPQAQSRLWLKWAIALTLYLLW